MLHDILGDLRTAIRQLGRAPAFTISAVTVLALGIGLNAAVFGFAYVLVFAGRPFADPSALLQLYSRDAREAGSYRAFSYGAAQVAAARQDVFSGVTGFTIGTVGVREAAAATPRRTFTAYVDDRYFDVLGVRLAQGRAFDADEARAGSDARVAVVTHAFWTRTGRRADLLGSTISVNEQAVTVIGIAPPGFTGTMMAFGPEILLPFGAFETFRTDTFTSRRRPLIDPEAFELMLVGRLRPGLTAADAMARLAPTAAAMAEAFPAQYRGRELVVAPLPRFGISTSPMKEGVLVTVAMVFLGLAGAVLLIVCLNLASVIVARGQARQREFAIRLALGGGRFRIVRQLMVEALLLGLTAAVGGVLIGVPAVETFFVTLLSRLPITLAIDAGTRPAIVGGAIGFGVIAALLFALGPALSQSGGAIFAHLKHQLGDEAPTRRRWLRSPLVVAQIALSLALLVAAGLFVRLARDGTAVDVGASDATVLIDVDASLGGDDQVRGLQTYSAVEAALSALPGVDAAAIGVTVPFGGINLGYYVRRAGFRQVPGERPATPEAGRPFEAKWNAVGSGYLRAMGLQLRRGRTFTESETWRAGAPPVAIVDEILARQLWPDGDALGQMIHIDDDESRFAGPAGPRAVQIVGVVAPQPTDMFSSQDEGTVFVPFAQGYRSGVYFHVRPHDGAGTGLLDVVRRTIAATAPRLPIFGATTFGAHLASSLQFWGMRTLATAMTAVGAFATLIALIGVYGAKAYAVSRRSREFGVRLAVGASPASLRALILREAIAVGAVGVAIGGVLGAAVARALDAAFVSVVGFDAWTFTVAPVLLLVSCGLAAWVPARRASRLDPAQVMRAE